MENKRKIFIGVAWPYVNGDLHIGHLAGYLLPADITARFHRYLGDDVLMASGSDCFGTPITVEAEKRNISPQELVEGYYPKHVELFKKTGISFDIFTKTTTENHKKTVQDFFLQFLNKGYIYKESVEQYYDPKEKRFLPDRYVEGECPHCEFKDSRSDQCDNCGRMLGEEELKNPRSKFTGQPVSLKESEHYFFDLKKLEPFIKEYFENTSGNWKGWVKAETEGWLNRGLKSRAFTRDIKWGVPLPVEQIPESQRIKGIEDKRIYVWWEAVIGYFSASVEWGKKTGGKWEDFWYNKDSFHYYFMGKDNLPFHTMFWPGELHLYDENLHLPDNHVINQYLNFGSEQFSKSRGVVVDSGYIVEKYGLDPVRLYLTSIMPEHADTSFAWEDFVERHNSVTIANFGNFINRTLKLAENIVPDIGLIDPEVIKETGKMTEEAKKNLLKPEFKKYAETLLAFSGYGNQYLSGNAPWKMADGEEKNKILNNALFMILTLQSLIKPLLIESTEKLEKILGVSFEKWPKDADDVKEKFEKIKIKNPEPLFRKIDKKAAKEETGG